MIELTDADLQETITLVRFPKESGVARKGLPLY
jgi:hypothetical protein